MHLQILVRITLLAMVISWPLSFALGNIAFGLLAALMLAYVALNPKAAQQQWRANRKALWLVVVMLLLVFIEVFYSHNFASWAQHIGFRSAALVYLLLFAFYQPPQSLFKFLLFDVLPGILALMAVLNLVHFYAHHHFFLNQLTWSHSIPIVYPWRNPFELQTKSDLSHIYFAILSAIATLLLLNRALASGSLRQKNTVFHVALAIVLIAYLHIFSERTGLLILYGALPVLFVYVSIVQHQRFRLLFASMLLFGVIAVASYQLLPTVKERVKKTREDIESFRKGDVHHHSIGKRLLAWEVGIEIFKANPVFGVGHADIDAEMQKIYTERGYHDPRGEQITYPHNQFIHTAAEGGVLQILALLSLLVAPLIWPNGYLSRREALIIITCIALSFISESFLERQIGAYFFWMLWALAVVRRP